MCIACSCSSAGRLLENRSSVDVHGVASFVVGIAKVPRGANRHAHMATPRLFDTGEDPRVLALIYDGQVAGTAHAMLHRFGDKQPFPLFQHVGGLTLDARVPDKGKRILVGQRVAEADAQRSGRLHGGAVRVDAR